MAGIASRIAWRGPGACCLALAALLNACGGGHEASPGVSRAAQEAAATTIDPERLPDLHRCLGGLSAALQQATRREELSLACLAGTYKGTTAQGRECALRIDAAQGLFSFSHGDRLVVIAWAEVAQTAAGRPIHNLEAADLDARRPGVQLSRFSPVPQATTESLVLRAGLPQAGPAGLPVMTYLLAQPDRQEEVRCRFGT